MRVDRIGVRSVMLVAAVLVATGVTTAVDRSQVEQASVIVIGDLLGVEELTAGGTDHGRGVLRVDQVIYPTEFVADRLLLRWSNRTGSIHSRIDPRVYIGQPSLWLVSLEADGTVRMIDGGGVFPLSRIEEIERLAADLWTLDGNGYDDKVIAIRTAIDVTRPAPIASDPTRRTPPPVAHELIEFALRDYDRYPEFKAFAIAVDDSGRWVYGYSHERPTRRLAEDHALRECSIRAARTRVNAACRLYAVGDRIVW